MKTGLFNISYTTWTNW